MAEVGVLDLLKVMKFFFLPHRRLPSVQSSLMSNTALQFDQYTIGRAWTCDYGDPQVPEDFDFIYPISPLHNIPTDKVLPPTILFTADRESISILVRWFGARGSPSFIYL